MYGPRISWLIALAGLILGAIAWVRVSSAAIGMAGIGRWLLTFFWSLIGMALVVGAMIGATWLLRAARAVYHPWYARPDRLFLLLLTVGAGVGWAVVRVGQWLPARAHGLRHPVMTWSATLPLWILLASASLWLAPGAVHLWSLPLLTAGLLLAIVRPVSDRLVRLASLAVLAVSAMVWFPDVVDLLRFMVAIFGRLPIVTPVYVYAAVMTVAALMLVPPLAATFGRTRPLLHPALMTAVLLLAVSICAGFAYVAPAYTHDEPLRRYVRALQPIEGGAIWEVASVEPGLDLAPGPPEGWTTPAGPLPAGAPWTPLNHPFVFRTTTAPLGPAPLSLTGFAVRPAGEGLEMEVTAVPREPGLSVTFLLPTGAHPARANLPGVRTRTGLWAATYVAVPPEGVVFRATFGRDAEAALQQTQVLVRSPGFPGGEGWQRLPPWLPQDRMVWTGSASWQLKAVAAAALAPVPPLR
jgi:hypothetical protein